MTCAAIDARMRFARRAGIWRMHCQTYRSDQRLGDELCVGRIAGRAPRLTETAADYQPENCVARVEYKAQIRPDSRPMSVQRAAAEMQQNRRESSKW